MGLMDVRIKLEKFKILATNEGSGDDEPYLWVIYLKVDGTTLSVTSLSNARADFHAPSGSQNDLGFSSDDWGDLNEEVSIPKAIGEWNTQLTTVTIPPGLDSTMGETLSVVAVVVVCIEEDATKASASEDGRKALVKTLKEEVNKSLRAGVAPKINEIAEQAKDAVLDAITSASVSVLSFAPITSLIDLGGIVDPDDFIGSGLAGPVNFQQIRNSGVTGIPFTLIFAGDGKYRVTGRIGRTDIPTLSTVGAVSLAPNRIDVFGRGDDHRTWYVTSADSANNWGSFEAIGDGVFTSGPAVANSRSDGFDVCARGNDRRIWRAASSNGGKSWGAWAPIGEGTFISAPAVVSRGPNRLDVFACGDDRRIWRAASSNGGNNWEVAWKPIEVGTFTSGPTAVSLSPNRLDVFARGNDRRIWHAVSTNGGETWQQAWKPIPVGTFISAPTAVSRGPNLLDVFALGDDRRIWQAVSTNGGETWQQAWKPIPVGTFISSPTAVSRGPNLLDVFALGDDRRIWRAASSNGGNSWEVTWKAVGNGHFY